MSQDLKTLELAKIYDSQGYYEDAFEIYSFLDKKHSSNETRAGLKRTGKKDKIQDHNHDFKANISRQFEKWLMLMVLKQRLDHFIKIKSRLS